MNANFLKSGDHLSDVEIDKLVKSIGLYAPILISTMPIEPNAPRFTSVHISEDIQKLY